MHFVHTVLGRSGYHVLTGGSTEEAWQACHQGAEALDLMILDSAVSEGLRPRLEAMYPRVPVLPLDEVASGELLERVRRALERPGTEQA